MARRKKIRQKKEDSVNGQYVGIEPGLQEANREFITVDYDEMEAKKIIIEKIVRCLVSLMRKQSPNFKYLFHDIFGGGSVYDGLKIDKPDEFDIDILMRIPEITDPVLIPNNIPGYVNLKLMNFEDLQYTHPDLYSEMEDFVDEKNYLLTNKIKAFMQSVFDKTIHNVQDNTIWIEGEGFTIARIQNLGPAFTLTIEGFYNFEVTVDLVPCIHLDADQWPGEGFSSNPYQSPSDFFLVPKSPKRDMPHIERYWRLSFQKQEREIIFDRQWSKPTIRVLKRVRDHFGHRISSYAIKTIFMTELKLDNPSLDDDIPDLWLGSFSYCVVHMLEVYAQCLENGGIPYFWNKKLNLIEDLSEGQKSNYKNNIEEMLDEIKQDPVPETILKYLS